MKSIVITIEVDDSASELAIAVAASLERLASVTSQVPATLRTDPNVTLEYVRMLDRAGIRAEWIVETTDQLIDSEVFFPRPAAYRSVALTIRDRELASERSAAIQEFVRASEAAESKAHIIDAAERKAVRERLGLGPARLVERVTSEATLQVVSNGENIVGADSA